MVSLPFFPSPIHFIKDLSTELTLAMHHSHIPCDLSRLHASAHAALDLKFSSLSALPNELLFTQGDPVQMLAKGPSQTAPLP